MKKRRLLVSFLVLLPLCLLHGWLWGPAPSRRNVTILLWHWPFGRTLNLTADVCWDVYGVPGCRLLDQRSSYASADVVVFHNRELMQGRQALPFDLPRPRGQRWAWMSLEPPVYNGNLTNYANVFNLTVSYRRDADVSIPYGELLPGGGQPANGAAPVPRNKSSLVCWVVSNYRRSHRRSRVFRQLRAAVPVKVYGRWSAAPLSADALLPTISGCYFYLAFENSVAKDYITEKLWRNAYQAGAVPVVLGPPAQDYRAVAPPKSFIHVDDFGSLDELGATLRQLAADRKLYAEYFRWREEWRVKLVTDWRERLCKICSRFEHLPQHRVYGDLDAWVRSRDP